ncbi:hypothetical protein COV82_00205 [Candidatus Peregrinibacteria bacterium CG11_big_fil_rev_8_21_14_0_20_46_8]|nr:MAG: hypothetical protein COV82_00205 [Candidatus Peregrinibacteria bacterium CG11_big_fil_rev_8_21_14_0_20_46_8]
MQLKKTLKQFALVTGLSALALLLFNALGADLAFAQAIAPEDQPGIISQLSGGQTGLRGIALTIVNFFLTFLGLLAVIMIIYGGFLYVGSAGNEENVNKAKKILMYAAIGILVIIVSFAFVNTILGAATVERPT